MYITFKRQLTIWRTKTQVRYIHLTLSAQSTPTLSTIKTNLLKLCMWESFATHQLVLWTNTTVLFSFNSCGTAHYRPSFERHNSTLAHKCIKITFCCQILVQTEISQQIKVTFRYRTQDKQFCSSVTASSEVFTTALLKIQVLGDITPCRLANGTDVSDDRNYLISGMLRCIYWYICRRFGG